MRVAATADRSWPLQRARSVPSGKYCRSRSFVFSFVPRCQGAVRVAEIQVEAGGDLDPGVSGELSPTIPG